MNPSPKTQEWLEGVRLAASTSGRPDEDFFYLGGPMTGIPHHNFDRFDEVAAKLRAQHYNIVSPAELDDEATRDRYYASETGHLERAEYDTLLGRDLVTVALPTCVGGIFLEGWENSRGAAAESWVLSYLNRPLYEYHERQCDECRGTGQWVRESAKVNCLMCKGRKVLPMLVNFDRDEHLLNVHGDPSVAGTVPNHKPGERTQAARDIEEAQLRLPTVEEAQKAIHETVHPPGDGVPFVVNVDTLRQKGLI